MRQKMTSSWAVAVGLIVMMGVLAGFASVSMTATTPDEQASLPTLPCLDDVHLSGTINTRVYVNEPSPLSVPQGAGQLHLTGYVHYANNITHPWVPWPNVSISMKMNGTFVLVGGQVLNTTTNATGNFTLVYPVPISRAAGPWNVTAGVTPIASYNYTYNPAFSGTKTYNISITANTQIQDVTYAPPGFWNNDAFTIKGRLRTHAGAGVGGATVNATFNGTHVFTSNTTGPGGDFNVHISTPLNSSFNANLSFAGMGYYNPSTVLVLVPFIESAFHAFSGDILTITPENPKPVNTNFTLQGRFTYNTSLYPGDGNVKNKRVFAFWIDNNSVEHAIGSSMTSATGTYSIPCHVNVTNPLSGMPTTIARVRVLLDVTTIQPVLFNRTVHIRPLVPTLLNVILTPGWRDESITIRGTLRENEAPGFTQVLPGYSVNVSLWNGGALVASAIRVTNATGGFSYTSPVLDLEAVNYTVTFPVTGRYNASSRSGSVPIFKNATFTFAAGMVVDEYPGFTMTVDARAWATHPGFPDRPVPDRAVHVYWNGQYQRDESLDGNGRVLFDFTIPAGAAPGDHPITLQLADFNQTGYLVSSNRVVEVVPLVPLVISFNASAMAPVFYHVSFTIHGTVTNTVPPLPRYPNDLTQIIVNVTFSDAIVQVSVTGSAGGNGAFSIIVPADLFFTAGLDPASINVTIHVAPVHVYAGSSLAPQPVKVIQSYRFLPSPGTSTAKFYLTEFFQVTGRIEGQHGTGYYPLPGNGYTCTFNGRHQWSDITGLQGQVLPWVQSEPGDVVGAGNVLRFTLDGDTHPSISHVVDFSMNLSLVRTAIDMFLVPAWRDEPVVIHGVLYEDEGPVYTDVLPGRNVNVSLWDGDDRVASEIIETNTTGGFSHAFPALFLDEITYTVHFAVTGKHDASTSTGNVLLYKNATFTFDAAMVVDEYPGFTMTVDAMAWARHDGFEDRPVANRDVNLYWEGAFWGTSTLDGGGRVLFDFTVPVDALPGPRVITLHLADFTGPGYNVSSGYTVAVVPLVPLTITFDASAMVPVFYHMPFTINGTVINDVLPLPRYVNDLTWLSVGITFSDGINQTSLTSAVTAEGFFHVYLAGDALFAAGLDPAMITVSIQVDAVHVYNSASLAPQPLQVIRSFRFLPSAGAGAETRYITSLFSITGRIEGVHAGLFYRLPDNEFNISFNGRYQGSNSTDEQARLTAWIQSTNNDSVGTGNVLEFTVHGHDHPSINSTFTWQLTLADLGVLALNVHPSIGWDMLDGVPVTVQGNVSSAIGGMTVIAKLRYAGPPSYTLLAGGVTTTRGAFSFEIPAVLVNASLSDITVVANPDNEHLLRSATQGPFMVQFTNGTSVANLSIQGAPVASVGSIPQGATVIVSGHLVSTNRGTPVRDRTVTVVVIDAGGTERGTFTGRTNAHGRFSVSVNNTVAAGTNMTLRISEPLLAGGPVSHVIPVSLVQDLAWILWLIPPVIAGLIVLSVYLARYRLKREKVVFRSKLQRRMDVVRDLARTGKIREAIGYCYHLLVEIASKEYGLDEKKDGQTVREFVEMLVKEKGIAPFEGFPFLDIVLESLYSHHEITMDLLTRAVTFLATLYVRITSDHLGYDDIANAMVEPSNEPRS